MWCAVSHSQIYEINKCYSNNGKEAEWKIETWNFVSKEKKQFIDPITHERTFLDEKIVTIEDNIVTIDASGGKIFLTEIKSDYAINSTKDFIKWIETTDPGEKFKENFLNDNENYKKMTGMTLDEVWSHYLKTLKTEEKISQEEFSLLTITGNLVVGEKKERFSGNVAKTKIYINLDKATYTKNYEVNDKHISEFYYMCNSKNIQTDGEKGDSSGTAFFINNKGHLLTNYHVVQGCTLSKISYKNKDYDTKLIATDKTLDLALLKADLKPKSFFTFSKNEAKKLNKVYVAGYPLGKGLSDDLKISSGIISSLKGFEDNSNEIQIDAPINPGNSGGPIINENGDLVAIAVSGLAKDQTEGINFGIKSSSAEIFLRTNKINVKKSMYAGIKDNDRLLEILEEGTVYTYCN